MDFEFRITNEGEGYKVELHNEFGRLVSWSWNTDIYAAVLEAVTWQLKQSPGDVRDVVRALLSLDLKAIETSLKMEELKKEVEKKKEEVYIKT
jgi:hypothetical protein